MSQAEIRALQEALHRVKFRRDTILLESLHEEFEKRLVDLYVLLDKNEGEFFAPYSGVRTFESQASLYRLGRADLKGRRLPGPIVTNADAGDSAHNWGCAADFGEFRPGATGQQVWNDANWDVFAKCVRLAGLTWGGDFKMIDRPHVELKLRVRWSEVGKIYRARGAIKALEFINENLEG